MSWLDDIENAVEDAFKDAFEAISAAFQAGETVIGDVIDVVGAPLQFVIEGVAYEIGDLIGIHIRRLTPAECNILKGVFGTSLPADKIYLTSLIGIDHRAFTLPGSMVADVAFIFPPLGLLLAMSGMFEHLQDKYLIQAGTVGSVVPADYDNLFHEKPGSMLVHESTHVWQGIHSAWSWWYVFESLYSQYKCGLRAYDVKEDDLHTWNAYGVEQQAHLVENWYSRGSLQSDCNYPFIRDNIRPGRPSAVTKFPPKTIVKPRPGQMGQVLNPGGNRAAV